MTATPVPVKVFLADDSAMIRSRVAAMLVAREMPIVGEAETPEGCIEDILATRPDVVVLDIQLEGGTGLQVLRAVRAADLSVAFVVFSSTAVAGYRKRYIAEGAERFLDETSEFDQLADAVAHASHTTH
jgi:DNA-binding NarL/FixJ family response regulator